MYFSYLLSIFEINALLTFSPIKNTMRQTHLKLSEEVLSIQKIIQTKACIELLKENKQLCSVDSKKQKFHAINYRIKFKNVIMVQLLTPITNRLCVPRICKNIKVK